MPAYKIDYHHSVVCPICSTQFVICRSCFRGHRYCCHDCRDHGYREARRRARRKYSQSTEARLDHCDRNRRYRFNKKWTIKNCVMDKSSKIILEQLKPSQPKLVNQPTFCFLCGCKCFSEGEFNESTDRTQNFRYPNTPSE